MSALRSYTRHFSEPALLLRAVVASLLVGTILTAINHAGQADALLRGEFDAGTSGVLGQIALTYVVPFLVAMVSSIAATERHRRLAEPRLAELERRVDLYARFPDANPHPVMRIRPDGELLYANAASAPIARALGIAVGEHVPAALLQRFRAASASTPPQTVEIEWDHRTYAVLTVPVPALDALTLYGTDVTAAKLLDKFPGLNPNPVLRLTPDGTLVYANDASAPIVRALGVGIGDPISPDLLGQVRGALDAGNGSSVEVASEGRTFALKPVAFEELGIVNLYGTDITAARAMNKFPDQNPNPVLRVTWDGELAYANPASHLVLKALGTAVGGFVPSEFFSKMQGALAPGASNVLEVESDGRIYELLVVSVYEFNFINLYGTDVTAVREVVRAEQEIERLLLNILPQSIADRLRHGETVIADRFEEMTILFADVVDFTRLSARLTPEALVQTLNRVFTVFDRLAERHGLEKIKTIGDAYMVVGGLTPHPVDHAERVAEMGQEMIEECARLTDLAGGGVQVRVGMHTGPGIGGVIGIKKFIYDVWGDAVNTASRMESHGVPGRIQVTEATYQRLKRVYRFQPRGTVDVKGKGPMHTYLLLDRLPRPPAARASAPALTAGTASSN